MDLESAKGGVKCDTSTAGGAESSASLLLPAPPPPPSLSLLPRPVLQPHTRYTKKPKLEPQPEAKEEGLALKLEPMGAKLEAEPQLKLEPKLEPGGASRKRKKPAGAGSGSSRGTGRQYRCTVCQAPFSSSGNRQRHEKTVHAELTHGLCFPCPNCGTRFASLAIVKAHLASC